MRQTVRFFFLSCLISGMLPGAVTDGLVAYYPLDGNADDASGNGNNGIVYGAIPTEDESGFPEGAFGFDGIDDYIDIGNRVKPALPLTMTVRIKARTAHSGNILRNDQVDASSYRYGFRVALLSSGQIEATVYSGFSAPWTRKGIISNESLCDIGQWHHLAVVFYAPTDIRLFWDGVEKAGSYHGEGSTMTYSGASGAIGNVNVDPYVGNFNGELDEIRVYERALTQEDVQQLVLDELPRRRLSSPYDPRDCPPAGGGPVSVTISQVLGDFRPEDVVDVIETILGDFGAAKVTAPGAAVSEVILSGLTPFGFIDSWLLLGPYGQTGGYTPGFDAMRQDYLTDGARIEELSVQAVAGDIVNTDYAVAASTGLAVSGAINPWGVPRWNAWMDPDDTIDFNDYYGGDVDNIMMYAVTYINLLEPIAATLCVGSDDSIQVLIDGIEVWINNVGRGVGSANECQDTVTIAGGLDAGLHMIMVKVFEGGGAHGFRLRITDTSTGRVPEGMSVCLYPSVPCLYGVQMLWEATRQDLAEGLDYVIDVDFGAFEFSGTVADELIGGAGTFTLARPLVDYGTVIQGIEHGHDIGQACVGTGVSSPIPGVIRITGAGADIWGLADQFVYAYREVTGDFSATVRIFSRTMGKDPWAKHGIMARETCGASSRFFYCADQQDEFGLGNSTAVQWRDIGDEVQWADTPLGNATNLHANVLRVDRVGNVFVGYALDEDGSLSGLPGQWIELGRRDWDIQGGNPPASIQLGLAVTSHDGCNLVSVEFADWQVSGGTPPEIISPVRSGVIVVGDTLRLAAEGPAAQYLWDFGDGRTSSLKVPGLISFPTMGEREVRLSYLDAYGMPWLAADTRFIMVAPDPGDVPDLVATALDVPEGLAVGQTTEITYSVRNGGDAALTGATWVDAIYLSRDIWLDTTDTQLAASTVSQDLPLNASYEGVLSVTLPTTSSEGSYYMILSVDDEWRVLERRQLNNEYYVPTNVLIPQLNEGVECTTSHGDGMFYHYYRIHVAVGGQGLYLTFNALQPGMTVYVRHGALPTPGVYDYQVTDGQLLIPAAAAGDWYVIVVGEDVPEPGDYTLEFDSVTLHLSSASPTLHAANVPLNLTVTGAGFQAPLTVELLDPRGAAYTAPVVEVDSVSRLTAVFPADTLLPEEVYDVRVTCNGNTAELAGAIRVVGVGESRLETRLVLPSLFGYHELATVYVEYANAGTVSMPAPLLVVTATQNSLPGAILTLEKSRCTEGLWSSVVPEGFANSVQFLASGAAAGILQPGESGRIPVYYVGWQQPWDFSYPPLVWSVGVLEADNQVSVDWAAMKADMRPSYVREDAWEVLWANFTAHVGATWGDYVAMLSRDAVYLDRQGQRVQDITRLLAFTFRQADALNPLPVLAAGVDVAVQAPGLPIVFHRAYAQPISRRFELGPLGRGWTHNWQYRLEVRDNGSVAITDMTGTPRLFQPDLRPDYPFLAAPGDQGVLRALVDGGFKLTEANGVICAFRADGMLDYIEDTNANRLTCEYDEGHLTRIVHSSGQSVSVAYNGAGYVASVTDLYGRQAQYTYIGEYLVSVQAHDGRVMTYAYDTTPSKPSQHALLEIGLPDGVRRTFAYDARGRLAAASRDGDKETVTFTYDAEGRVTATDLLGSVSRFFLDDAGRIVKIENPLGCSVRLGFDQLGQLAAVTDPVGLAWTFAYDRRGNLIAAKDALGHTTRFAYTLTLNRLASLADANGNCTWYVHDGRGNLGASTYSDGTSETWTYDARGNPIAWVNRRGHGIVYEYDANGRVTRKICTTTGETVGYSYLRDNLVQAVDANGVTSVSYNEHDYLTRIDYPAGRWLEFTYDDAGRRASSLDQTGRRLEYQYDAAGRLERITDEIDAGLVHYEYDTVGRLARKTVGNGVYTDYTYDAAGQLVSLVNRAPDDSAISYFDYTYDRRGRRTAVDTHYGVWTYEYDDIGQLTRAVLVSTAGDIPNQDLRYVYDALGNRISATVNGVEEEYSTNRLNQYMQVGDRNYRYDLDGNLIEETGPDGTTVYTYNDENRLIGVTRGADEWEYTYDALGNRVAVAANGVVTHYVVDPIGLGNIVGEYDAAGNLVAHYDHCLGLLDRTDAAGSSAYYTFDALGNVSEFTGAAGVIRNAYTHRPFGETLRHIVVIPNPFEFVGEWGVMAEGSGLNYVRERYQRPSSGRFEQIDPIGIKGGINLYTYAFNSPTILNDPSGTVAECGGARFKWVSRGFPHRVVVLGRGYDRVAYDFVPGEHWRGQWRKRIVNPDGTFGEPIILGYGPLYVLFWTNCIWGADRIMEWFCGHSKQPPWPPEIPADTITKDDSNSAGSEDPNTKTGPSGYGARNYVTPEQLLAYRVEFENLESATAPAQVVTVADRLSASFNWTTFALTEISFGDELITVPEDKRQYFETVVDYSYKGTAFEVYIQAGIHLSTGEAFAYFYTIDSETGWPPPVDIGFLPPEDGTGRGKGHVTYVIRAKTDLPNGTEIRNVATIQFDFGLKIDTNQVNPLDPSEGTDPTKEALVTISEMGWLQVRTEPEEATGAMWSIIGTDTWYLPGVTAQIPIGEHTVVFMAVADWRAPENQVVMILNGETTLVTGTYVQQTTGSLSVSISPAAAVTAGARWRRVGEETWLDSGAMESAIPIGSYTVECKDIIGWTKPANQVVTIFNGQTTTVSGTYEREAVLFRRGDVNASGEIDIADAVFALSYLFANGKIPTCLDAADANDDGTTDIADAIKILGHLFAAEGPLPAPFEECGIDPTLDGLECGSFAPCE